MATLGTLLRKFNWTAPSVKLMQLGWRPGLSTALKMKAHIREGSHNPYVRHWAETIVEDVATRDEWGEVEAVFNFLQDASRYAHDPKGLEYIQTPRYVLGRIERGEVPSLDCDDHTVTSLALLRSLGYEVKIKVVGFAIGKPHSHVYGMVKIKGTWTPFDAVNREKGLGWESSKVVKSFEVKV